MKLDRLKMHQEWFDKNQHLIFLEAHIVMQELLAMTREARNQRDEARREVMSRIIDQACRSEDVDKQYKKRGWEYLKENTDYLQDLG
jgi:hypothetical protein